MFDVPSDPWQVWSLKLVFARNILDEDLLMVFNQNFQVLSIEKFFFSWLKDFTCENKLQNSSLTFTILHNCTKLLLQFKPLPSLQKITKLLTSFTSKIHNPGQPFPFSFPCLLNEKCKSLWMKYRVHMQCWWEVYFQFHSLIHHQPESKAQKMCNR